LNNSIDVVTKAQPIIDACINAEVIIIDTETSSLRPWVDGKILAGIGIKPLNGEMFYLPLRHRDSRNASITELHKLCKVFENKTLVFHNPKFDLAVLYQDGEDLSNERILDTVVMVRLVSEAESSYALKKLAEKYYPFAAEEEKDKAKTVENELRSYMRKNNCYTLDAKGEKEYRYDYIPAQIIAYPYVYNDLRFTEFFYKKCITSIEKRKLQDVFELEINLTKSLFEMEKYGFLIDLDFIASERAAMQQIITESKKEAYALAKNGLKKNLNIDKEKLKTLLEILGKDRKEFNVSNPHFIKKIFEGMGLKSPRTTEKGAASWNKIALASMEDPIANLVVRARASINIYNYYERFLDMKDANNILHPSFNQAGTKTGRLSCREPNLQNIPAGSAVSTRIGAQVSAERLKKQLAREKEEKEKAQRYSEIGKKQIGFDQEIKDDIISAFEKQLFGKVRGAFIPRPGHILVSIDWQNIEMRVFADYAKEAEMMETFRLGLDIHRLTARAAFGLMPDEHKQEDLFKWVRQMGKQIAFGLLYGMGIKLLAAETGKTEAEAKVFMVNFFSRFVHAKEFIKTVGKRVETVGYLKNRWGRRRYLSGEESFKGVNYLVQSTAADLMKDALCRVEVLLRDYKSKPIITVHDEIIFDIAVDEIYEVLPLIVNEMEQCAKVTCDLKCDVEWADVRWGELHKTSCDECDGKGLMVNMDKAELIEALFVNDYEKLSQVTSEKCTQCMGHGYDLKKIKI
jgi:DNA polymerase-1